MKRPVVVPANDKCRANTTQSLFDIETSNYSGEHRVCQFFQNSTSFPSEPLFKYELSILLRAANTGVPDKNSIRNWRKLGVICLHILFPLLHKRQRRPLLNLLEKAVGEVSQLTKLVVPIIGRCLGVNQIFGN